MLFYFGGNLAKDIFSMLITLLLICESMFLSELFKEERNSLELSIYSVLYFVMFSENTLFVD